MARRFSHDQLTKTRYELNALLLEYNLDTVSDISICQFLDYRGIEFPYAFVSQSSLDWSKYSGKDLFPVPAPDGGCPKNFYYKNHKWLGKYGQLRLELVEFLIEKINEELENDQKRTCIASVRFD